MMIKNFLFRPIRGEIIANVSYLKSMVVPISPIFILVVVGFLNFGEAFFWPSHWTTMHGLFVHPAIGIPAIALVVFLIFYNVVDIYRCHGAYLSIDDNFLIFKSNKLYSLRNIDKKSVSLSGVFNNILEFKYEGKMEKIPLSYAKERPLHIKNRIEKFLL